MKPLIPFLLLLVVFASFVPLASSSIQLTQQTVTSILGPNFTIKLWNATTTMSNNETSQTWTGICGAYPDKYGSNATQTITHCGYVPMPEFSISLLSIAIVLVLIVVAFHVNRRTEKPFRGTIHSCERMLRVDVTTPTEGV